MESVSWTGGFVGGFDACLDAAPWGAACASKTGRGGLCEASASGGQPSRAARSWNASGRRTATCNPWTAPDTAPTQVDLQLAIVSTARLLAALAPTQLARPVGLMSLPRMAMLMLTSPGLCRVRFLQTGSASMAVNGARFAG